MWFGVALIGVLGLAPVSPAAADECREPVEIARVWSAHQLETARLVLVDCAGEPREEALEELSILARPHGVDRPAEGGLESIRMLDPGLLVRLDAIARRFPGRRLEIISGHRPRARNGSRHRHAKALDVHVDGVDNLAVATFALSLPRTGVGYYPNSGFTHVDVRDRRYSWIDHSGPGQRADYGPWPVVADGEAVVATASATGSPSAVADSEGEDVDSAEGQPAATEPPPLGPEDARRIRDGAIATLRTLLDPSPAPSPE